MPYDIDFEEEAEISFHIKKFLLYPLFWSESSNQINTRLVWNKTKFISSNRTKIPSSKGVYAFVLRPKYNDFFDTHYLFYVGKTNRTLKERFKEYLNEKDKKGKVRKKIHKMLNLYDGYLYFYYTQISQSTVVDLVEEKLLNTFVPHVNTTIPKAKIKNELKNIYEQS